MHMRFSKFAMTGLLYAGEGTSTGNHLILILIQTLRTQNLLLRSCAFPAITSLQPVCEIKELETGIHHRHGCALPLQKPVLLSCSSAAWQPHPVPSNTSLMCFDQSSISISLCGCSD